MSEEQKILFEIYLENNEFKIKAKESEDGIDKIGDSIKKTEQPSKKMAESFKQIEKSAALFGTKTDELTQKNKLLRSAMEVLLEKGVNPNSKGFAKLKTQYDDNAKAITELNPKVKTFGDRFGGVSTLIKGFSVVALVKGLYDVAKAALTGSAEMEKQKIAFTTMLGSADKADLVLSRIEKFASTTPFGTAEVVDASKKLIAFGEDASTLEKTLRKVGDVASGVSMPLDELVEIYGKARVQNTLYAEDLNQLAGRGIPVFKELGKVMGVPASQVKKLGSEGKITFQQLEQAFTNMTSAGGQFAGLMDAQSKGLSGQWSNFGDNMARLAKTLGDALAPAAKGVLNILNLMTESDQTEFTREMDKLASLQEKIIKKYGEQSTASEQYGGLLEEEVAEVEREYGVIVKAGATAKERLAIYKQLIGLSKEEAQIMGLVAGGEAIRSNLAATDLEIFNKKGVLTKDQLKAQIELNRENARGSSGKTGGGKDNKKADMVSYYTAIDELSKASITKLQNDQDKEIANVKLALQQKLISKKESEAAIKEIEDQYRDKKIAAEEAAHQLSVINEETAWQAKQQATYNYYKASYGFESKAFQGSQMIAQAGMTLMNEKNKVLFNVGKAATIANMIMSTAEGIMKAWSFGPIIGTIYSAIIGATSTLQIGRVAMQKPPEPVKMSNSYSLPSFAVGTWAVPYDMTANIHQGEMIISKPFADSVRAGEGAITGGGASGTVIHNYYFSGSYYDSAGLLEAVDDAQEKRAGNMGATKYTTKSPY